MKLPLWRTDDPRDAASVEQLLATLRGGELTAADSGDDLRVGEIVQDILARVRDEGDAAVAELTSRLDRADVPPERLRVAPEVLAAAHAAAEPAFLALVRRAAANIRAYQEHILHPEPPPLVRGGRRLGVRYTPIERVGVYVPGGRAFYPSTVLMTIVPAQVAGVGQVVVASPPTGGEIAAPALALLHELGVDEVYRMGGAVAVAALAYGTGRIPPVAKIVGPGNAFVAAAKRQLFGQVGIDSIAGPSEVLVIADERARPDWVAADLIAQAEHDPGSAVLVTPSERLARAVAEQVEVQLAQLERGELARPSLERYSALIVCPDLEAACELANRFAPEHLQIMTADDEACLARIRHAGAVFVGDHTPVPLGDYYAGPSHVLPTGGTAAFFGPLSCNDFRKASSVVAYDPAALAEDVDDVADFATREGLTAHARAARIRGEEPAGS